MSENFELQEIAGYFSKLEYLRITGKLTKEFISKFLSKLPNLKYFSTLEFNLKSHETLDLIKEIFPYPIEKHKLRTQVGAFSNRSDQGYVSVSIRSPNVIAEWKDSPTRLYVKKLVKKGDSFTPKYFAYDIPYGSRRLFTISIVFESGSNKESE